MYVMNRTGRTIEVRSFSLLEHFFEVQRNGSVHKSTSHANQQACACTHTLTQRHTKESSCNGSLQLDMGSLSSDSPPPRGHWARVSLSHPPWAAQIWLGDWILAPGTCLPGVSQKSGEKSLAFLSLCLYSGVYLIFYLKKVFASHNGHF